MRALLFIGLCAAPALAGGWTQPEGGLYAKLTDRLVSGSGGYLSDGSGEDLGGDYVDTQVQLYAEYGATADLTLVAHLVPYGYADFEAKADGVEGGRTHYVGPLDVGARYGLLTEGALRVAVEARYAWQPPVGDGVLARGRDPVFEYEPTVAGHRFTGELQAGAGLPWGFWVALSGGWTQLVVNETDPAFTAFGQLGVSRWGVVLEGHVAAHLPTGDVTRNDVAGTRQTRYVGRGFSVSYWFVESFAMSFGRDGVFLVESNLRSAPYLFGIEHRGAY